MSHYLYLVRPGEPRDAEHGILDGPLSDRGLKQAHLAGRRLQGISFDICLTSPIERAVETAAVLDQYVEGPPMETSTLLFECLPSGSEGAPEFAASFFAAHTAEEVEAGRAQMEDARHSFMTKSRTTRRTLLVAHNFIIGEFVRAALGAPEWRWLGLNSFNGAITVIRVRTTKPVELVSFNDAAHLPAELLTGMTASPGLSAV